MDDDASLQLSLFIRHTRVSEIKAQLLEIPSLCGGDLIFWQSQ